MRPLQTLMTMATAMLLAGCGAHSTVLDGDGDNNFDDMQIDGIVFDADTGDDDAAYTDVATFSDGDADGDIDDVSGPCLWPVMWEATIWIDGEIHEIDGLRSIAAEWPERIVFDLWASDVHLVILLDTEFESGHYTRFDDARSPLDARLSLEGCDAFGSDVITNGYVDVDGDSIDFAFQFETDDCQVGIEGTGWPRI